MEHSEIDRFWSKVNKSGECWTWEAFRNVKKGGYGFFRSKQYKNMVQTHRYAWEITYGPIPNGFCVLHKCDNPPCVRPDHLFLGTKLDNAQDRDSKGRMNDRAGSKHPGAKLTEDEVLLIREILRGPLAYGEKKRLAEFFGVCPALLAQIRTRKCWTHI